MKMHNSKSILPYVSAAFSLSLLFVGVSMFLHVFLFKNNPLSYPLYSYLSFFLEFNVNSNNPQQLPYFYPLIIFVIFTVPLLFIIILTALLNKIGKKTEQVKLVETKASTFLDKFLNLFKPLLHEFNLFSNSVVLGVIFSLIAFFLACTRGFEDPINILTKHLPFFSTACYLILNGLDRFGIIERINKLLHRE